MPAVRWAARMCDLPLTQTTSHMSGVSTLVGLLYVPDAVKPPHTPQPYYIRTLLTQHTTNHDTLNLATTPLLLLHVGGYYRLHTAGRKRDWMAAA